MASWRLCTEAWSLQMRLDPTTQMLSGILNLLMTSSLESLESDLKLGGSLTLLGTLLL